MPSDKLCRDCVYYLGSWMCGNAKAEPFSCMVDGHPSRDVKVLGAVNAMTCRLTDAMCGPDAKWWEVGR